MEEIVAENNVQSTEEKKGYFKRNFRFFIILQLAIFFGLCHYTYSWMLFENDRNFAYLSELEREMSLRTEMGFYYSYYKTLAQDYPFTLGLTKMMYDELVEYPTTVNAFNRFNIHPEVVVAALFRYFQPWLNNSEYIECNMVERPGLEPVESCNGIGVPIIFYLESVWLMAGVTLGAIFLNATTISESIVGGILAVCQYFANHADATRVHFAPNERENFAWPLLLMQGWLVSLQLKDKEKKNTLQLQMGIFFLNCLSLLFWQFSQFILLTQTLIFFVMEQLGVIDNKSFCVFLHSHFCGLHMAVLLLQSNDMLKTSLYTSFFVIVSVYTVFFNSLRIKVENRVDLLVEAWLVLLRIAIVFSLSVYLKKVISQVFGCDEDSHIWDLLFAKFFSGFESFHTLMYTCSAVYDFLPIDTAVNLIKTSLLPITVINILAVLNRWYRDGLETKDNPAEAVAPKEQQDDEDSGIDNNVDVNMEKRKKFKKSKDLDDINNVEEKKVIDDECVLFLKRLNIEPDVFYSIAQLFVYGVLAGIIMRLKLLFVSQLCIISSLLMNKKYLSTQRAHRKYIKILWLVLFIPLVFSLVKNVRKETSYISEFEDSKLEELIMWTRHSSGSGVFAGTLPTMSAIMLSARKPIVVHPHYEHLETRKRAYSVYKVYGRFPPEELYQELTKLRVSYIVVERQYCYGRSNRNCSFVDIWDRERPELSSLPLLCRLLDTEPVAHFYPVFSNGQYTVYRVHDVSVEYMPRSFDT